MLLLHKAHLVCAAVLGASMCSGCAVPRYDVPYYDGQPTVETIVDRIQCEIRDMVRDDMPNDVTSFNRWFLLDGDYDVQISLSLEVNDTGGLSPSLAYLNPITKATSFMFGANGTLSESRDHNFTENIQLSVRTIYIDWKYKGIPHNCPTADTNLSGDLGIRNFVAMAALTQHLNESNNSAGKDQSKNSAGKSVFGGSIQFLVTKNLSAVGPTWSLIHFKGPGPLANVSEVNTDKITFAFAQGPNVGKPMQLQSNPLNPYAYSFLQQLLTSSINSQLIFLQSTILQNPGLILQNPGLIQ